MSNEQQLDWEQLPIYSRQLISQNIMNALRSNQVYIFGCVKGERCTSCSGEGTSRRICKREAKICIQPGTLTQKLLGKKKIAQYCLTHGITILLLMGWALAFPIITKTMIRNTLPLEVYLAQSFLRNVDKSETMDKAIDKQFKNTFTAAVKQVLSTTGIHSFVGDTIAPAIGAIILKTINKSLDTAIKKQIPPTKNEVKHQIELADQLPNDVTVDYVLDQIVTLDYIFKSSEYQQQGVLTRTQVNTLRRRLAEKIIKEGKLSKTSACLEEVCDKETKKCGCLTRVKKAIFGFSRTRRSRKSRRRKSRRRKSRSRKSRRRRSIRRTSKKPRSIKLLTSRKRRRIRRK